MCVSASPSSLAHCSSAVYKRLLSGSRVLIVAILRTIVALLDLPRTNNMVIWHLEADSGKHNAKNTVGVLKGKEIKGPPIRSAHSLKAAAMQKLL